MSNFFSSIGNAVSRIFTIPGSGSAPSVPAPNFVLPTPKPPVPIPVPNSPAILAQEQQAQQKMLGFGRQATILTTMQNRQARTTNTIGGGGSNAGATYAAATLGGAQ